MTQPTDSAAFAASPQPEQPSVVIQPASDGFDAVAESNKPEAEALQLVIAERDENRNLYLRAMAELENYRRRVNREREDDRRYAPMGLIRDLLPALDNLRRGVDAAKSASSIEQLVQGVEMVLKQVDESLARHGATPIAAVGQPFDPNQHEALTQIPSADHPPMTVLQELERGYVLHDRVIRPTKVLVSAAPAS